MDFVSVYPLSWSMPKTSAMTSHRLFSRWCKQIVSPENRLPAPDDSASGKTDQWVLILEGHQRQSYFVYSVCVYSRKLMRTKISGRETESTADLRSMKSSCLPFSAFQNWDIRRHILSQLVIGVYTIGMRIFVNHIAQSEVSWNGPLVSHLIRVQKYQFSLDRLYTGQPNVGKSKSFRMLVYSRMEYTRDTSLALATNHQWNQTLISHFLSWLCSFNAGLVHHLLLIEICSPIIGPLSVTDECSKLRLPIGLKTAWFIVSRSRIIGVGL